MRALRTGLISTAVASGLAIVLAACSQPERDKEDYRMGHEAAKVEVEELYEKTIAIVGDGWTTVTKEWDVCGRLALTDTDSWNRFSQRIDTLTGPPEQIAARVAALWDSLGYEVSVVSDDELIPQRQIVSYPPFLTGTTTDGFSAVFTIGEGYADFDAGSRCVPSDPALVDRFPS
jgi:hypothetical protein